MTSTAPSSVSTTEYLAPTAPLPDAQDTRDPDLIASLEAAGWSKSTARVAIDATGFESLRWSNFRTLFAARSEKIAHWMKRDASAAMRDAWLDGPLPTGGTRRTAVDQPTVVPTASDTSSRVLVLGDTGDGSEAQWAVAQQLVGCAERQGSVMSRPGADAVLLTSDVVYPAGAADEYPHKFHRVYQRAISAGIPIYAVPGNHDWNDGSLAGFMATFCGATQRPPAVEAARRAAAGSGIRKLIGRWPLWSDASPQTVSISNMLPQPLQPGPYGAFLVGGVLFIGIDTGYYGTLDAGQAAWLVSTVDRHRDTPKILFTGKPLIVNGRREPCPFTYIDRSQGWVAGADGTLYASVDDVVRRKENGFVAAIGGDIHNYQRYLTSIESPGDDPRPLAYIVCGGGGVFVSQTAWLPKISLDEAASGDRVRCDEKQTVLFPRRYHSRLYLDAIIQQAASRARLMIPLALSVVAMIGLLGWMLHLPAPNPVASLGFLVTALALNVSMRPINVLARAAALTLAATGAALLLVALVIGDDDTYDTRSLARAAAAVFLGHVISQLADTEWFGRNTLWRWVGKVLSAVAVVAIAGAAAFAIWQTSHPWPLAVLAILTIVGTLAALSPVVLIRRVSPQEAYADAKRTIEDDPVPGEIRYGITKWLARNQRLFSVFETFTEGRVTHRARVKHWDVTHLAAAQRYLPLYRSFLEIEYRPTTEPHGWEFAFTAWAVTGEGNTDAPPPPSADPVPSPATVDTLKVTWVDGVLTVN